jgi:S-(hydroxymethyl)glutathione dehydrogenase/alcohol dehydrogenase
MARSFGATNLVRADQKDFDDQLLSMTNGVGFDFAVEATGNVEVVERAFESVRDFGGLCIFASHPPVGHKISIEPHALIRGKQIRGSWGGSTNPDKDIPKFVDLYLSGRLPLDKLISHRFKLDQINQAFKQFNEGRGQRILLDLN